MFLFLLLPKWSLFQIFLIRFHEHCVKISLHLLVERLAYSIVYDLWSGSIVNAFSSFNIKCWRFLKYSCSLWQKWNLYLKLNFFWAWCETPEDSRSKVVAFPKRTLIYFLIKSGHLSHLYDTTSGVHAVSELEEFINGKLWICLKSFWFSHNLRPAIRNSLDSLTTGPFSAKSVENHQKWQ